MSLVSSIAAGVIARCAACSELLPNRKEIYQYGDDTVRFVCYACFYKHNNAMNLGVSKKAKIDVHLISS